MAWYYNNNRIYVQSLDVSDRSIIARLQPVGYKTVLHYFGYETPIYKIQAKVVGSGILQNLMNLVDDATEYTLTGPQFSQTLALSNISYTRDQTYYQTLDANQDCETPVYTVTMEFYDS